MVPLARRAPIAWPRCARRGRHKGDPYSRGDIAPDCSPVPPPAGRLCSERLSSLAKQISMGAK
jgi:hypothetical protein